MVVTALDLADDPAIDRPLEASEGPLGWRPTIRARFPGVLQ